ncbi:hypothetical protein GCM10023347_34130 [Streptomyces chumphonensis]|uniref:Holin n=1 Tax=Streptomyces chumphonensis TaxID=1214925 RepID=A0A927EZJ3_9ACTN|nr:holin [Streptomyces chumphonensis]MBD3931917.1 holin [Streptomyces chumphonensis]
MPTTTAPVERKVTAASAATFVASTGLVAALSAVADDPNLLSWMVDWLEPFAIALVPTSITFVSGWAAKHTPRAPGFTEAVRRSRE